MVCGRSGRPRQPSAVRRRCGGCRLDDPEPIRRLCRRHTGASTLATAFHTDLPAAPDRSTKATTACCMRCSQRVNPCIDCTCENVRHGAHQNAHLWRSDRARKTVDLKGVAVLSYRCRWGPPGGNTRRLPLSIATHKFSLCFSDFPQNPQKRKLHTIAISHLGDVHFVHLWTAADTSISGQCSGRSKRYVLFRHPLIRIRHDLGRCSSGRYRRRIGQVVSDVAVLALLASFALDPFPSSGLCPYDFLPIQGV
jgi:hypothetical protein